MRQSLAYVLRHIRGFLLRGSRFYCPLCETGFRRFLSAGNTPRSQARCPRCESLERHRLLWIALNRLWSSGRLRKGGTMLHVAPEKPLADRFRALYDYLSADLDPGNAMVVMDITSIDRPDGFFDAIICNHVLEHVPEDRLALAELYRVLKPGGWASIQVPMEGESTAEDLSITDPLERTRLYGQSDHVRRYGCDFLSRLREAGFEVVCLPKEELTDPVALARLSVSVETGVVLALRKAEGGA